MHGNNAKTYFGVFSWFFNGIWARIAGTSNRDSFAYQTRISNVIVVHVGLFLIWLYDNDNKRNTIHGCRREKKSQKKSKKMMHLQWCEWRQCPWVLRNENGWWSRLCNESASSAKHLSAMMVVASPRWSCDIDDYVMISIMPAHREEWWGDSMHYENGSYFSNNVSARFK